MSLTEGSSREATLAEAEVDTENDPIWGHLGCLWGMFWVLDPRPSSSFLFLPVPPRDNMRFCMLANAKHAEVCEKEGAEFLTEDQLKAFKKNKKQIKKLGKKYDAFIASQNLIKKIPRLMGPGLNRAGKFPSVKGASDDLETKLNEIRSTVKFQLKKVICMNVAVGNVSMTEAQLKTNIKLAVNFLVSLLKKAWQNIKCLYIKSTMGPPFQIYF